MNLTDSTPTTTATTSEPRVVARRYAAPRHLLRWRTPHLAVLKMLAWVVREHERANTERLWRRCGELS